MAKRCYAAGVRSRELTEEQLARLTAVVDGHLDYYLRLWQRVQANRMTFDDPLAAPERTAGLRSVEQPWAQRQRDAAAAVEAAKRASPPRRQ